MPRPCSLLFPLLLVLLPCTAAAQTVRVANNSATPFYGWVRTVVDTKPAHPAGKLADDTRYAVARPIGTDAWAIDVQVKLQARERRSIDLSVAVPELPPKVQLPNDVLGHFGGWITVGGLPLGVAGASIDGAALAVHCTGRIAPMLHVDVWLRWYPSQPGMVTGEVVVCCSNGAVPDMGATVAQPLHLQWGDGLVHVLGAGWGGAIVPGATSFADGQARAVPFAVVWRRHVPDTDAIGWSQAVAGALHSTGAVGIERLWPDGNPQLQPGFDAVEWTKQLWPIAQARLHTWEPGVVGPNPNSGDTGAQEDQVFVRGEPFAPGGEGAEQVAYLAALEQASRPAYHLEANGHQADPLDHPNCVFWSGRPHWHRGVSPDQLGKGGVLPDTHGWSAQDREHWLINTLAAAARLKDSPALQWMLRQNARAFLFAETVRPGWSTSGPDAARSVGWAGIVAVHLSRGLEDQDLARRVGARYRERCELVYLPRLGGQPLDIWDVRVDDARLGPGAWWMAWQQSIGSYGLDLAARHFNLPFVRDLARRAALACVAHNWVLQGEYHGVGNIRFPPPAPSAYDDRVWPDPWFETTWDLPALWVVLQSDPGHGKARAIWQQAMGDLEARGSHPSGRRSWVPPGAIPAAAAAANLAIASTVGSSAAEAPKLRALAAPALTVTATVKRHDFTWTLDRPLPIGAFANGDPFVVGACKVLAITPAATTGGRDRNGSMRSMRLRQTALPTMNARHGFDSSAQHVTYDRTLNDGLALPIDLAPGDALVSTRSAGEQSGSVSAIAAAAVLTCMAVAPDEPVFRPPYWGPKTPAGLYRLADLDLERLTTVFVASECGDATQLAEDLERLWLIAGPEWGSYYLHPSEYMPPYYRERSVKLGEALMTLNGPAAPAEKRRLAIALAQWGIDLMWAVRNGVYWGQGHGPGRKSPVVFAGLVLGHEDLLNPNMHCPANELTPQGIPKTHEMVWGEDGTTYWDAAGRAEWGNFHWTQPASDSTDWENGTPYRFCCWSNAWLGEALALRTMGGLQNWDHAPWFAYVDRYVQWSTARGLPDWQISWSPKAHAAWQRLRRYDLPGVTGIGVVATGAPSLTVTRPPHAGSPWTLHLDAGQPGTRIGLLVRARNAALRPGRDFLGWATDGLVFLDGASAEAAVPFVLGGDGKGVVTIPPAGDVAGDEYVLQAALLFDGVLRPTNAAEVRILAPEGS